MSYRKLRLVEKANIDWNNYLSKDEVKQFLSKDDKTESAENIIYSKEFRKRYQDLHNDLQKKYNNSCFYFWMIICSFFGVPSPKNLQLFLI